MIEKKSQGCVGNGRWNEERRRPRASCNVRMSRRRLDWNEAKSMVEDVTDQ